MAKIWLFLIFRFNKFFKKKILKINDIIMPITVKRISDNQTFTVGDADENTKVGDLKNKLKAQFPPRFAHGKHLLYLNF